MRRLVEFIGLRAPALIWALAVLAAANVLIQLYTHKTTALTAWKGGGFGMYTEPHVDSRSVWLTFTIGGQSAHLRLWPESEAMSVWRADISVQNSAALGRITDAAEQLRYYPDHGAAADLLTTATRVRWRDTLTGGVRPARGKTFARQAMSLQVFENAYDIHAQTLSNVLVYALAEGG